MKSSVKLFLCGECSHEQFEHLSPDESMCMKCGKVHVKIDDYKFIESK